MKAASSIKEGFLKMATSVIVVFAIVNFIYIPLSEGHSCKSGFYGTDCDMECGQCIGGPVFCNSVNGFCANGCAWGYSGSTCHQTCSQGNWGYDCAERCSRGCIDGACNPKNGECYNCEPGYLGKDCSEECPVGTYGDDCVYSCSCQGKCGCDKINGTCLTGCESEEAPTAKTSKSDSDYAGHSRSKRHNFFENLEDFMGAMDKNSDPTEKGENTQMMCSEMKQKFADLREKLYNRVDIPYWPLGAILGVTFLIVLCVNFIDFKKQQAMDDYQIEWERQHIDIPLREALEKRKSTTPEMAEEVAESSEPETTSLPATSASV